MNGEKKKIYVKNAENEKICIISQKNSKILLRKYFLDIFLF